MKGSDLYCLAIRLAGILFIVCLAVALAVAYRPLGDYMYRVVDSKRHLRVERVAYRLIGVNPDGEQSWSVYARSLWPRPIPRPSCPRR